MMGRVACALTIATVLQVASAASASAREPGLAFEVAGGLAYTPDDKFDGVGWSISGSALTPLTEYWGLRTSVGGTFLEAEVDGRHPNANYVYATVGVMGADLFSFCGGAGLYYTILQTPLVADAQSRVKPGVYGGAQFNLPYRHTYFFTTALTGHRVFADGPEFFLVLSAGFVFRSHPG